MALYHYKLISEQNYHYTGALSKIGSDFSHYEYKSFGESTLYYKSNKEQVTDIIADSELTESYARKEILETFDFVKSID